MPAPPIATTNKRHGRESVTLRPRLLIPLAVFLAIAVFLGIGLTLDSDRVPSPLIGKPVPAFSLPAVDEPSREVRPSDFAGEPWLLNVWATWCVACRAEHGVLMTAANRYGATIVGLDYKDERPAALEWLRQRGDPYVVSAFDPEGQTGLDFGVYGVPETYVIDEKGIIRYKHIGPVSRDQLENKLLPLLAELREAG